MSDERQLPVLIPAAGRGTRLHPITRYLSKPMLPVGSRPLIDFALEEATRAGCAPIVVIGAPGDAELRSYLRARETESEVRWVEQSRPRGLADALLQGYRELDYSGPCGLVIPDNVVLDGPGIGELLPGFGKGKLVFGVYSVGREEAPFFGNSGRFESPDTEPLDAGDPVEICGLQEKGENRFNDAASEWPCWRAVARVILPPDFFELAVAAEPDPQSGELDDVPLYRQLIADRSAVGRPMSGKIYDTGTTESYLRFCHDYFEAQISTPE